jgi:trehalose synthase
VSRFDRWKDPAGVTEAFRKARAKVHCTLVLVGNNALDDPEGEVIRKRPTARSTSGPSC